MRRVVFHVVRPGHRGSRKRCAACTSAGTSRGDEAAPPNHNHACARSTSTCMRHLRVLIGIELPLFSFFVGHLPPFLCLLHLLLPTSLVAIYDSRPLRPLRHFNPFPHGLPILCLHMPSPAIKHKHNQNSNQHKTCWKMFPPTVFRVPFHL